MGFMDAMKGANMNFGTVDSPDFMACYITTKGDHFMITGAQNGSYEFTKADIAEFKVVVAGDSFVKWKMRFKDGKIAIITSGVKDPNAQDSGASMAPIERFFGDLLYLGSSEAVSAISKESIRPSIDETKHEQSVEETKPEEPVCAKKEEETSATAKSIQEDRKLVKCKKTIRVCKIACIVIWAMFTFLTFLYAVFVLIKFVEPVAWWFFMIACIALAFSVPLPIFLFNRKDNLFTIFGFITLVPSFVSSAQLFMSVHIIAWTFSAGLLEIAFFAFIVFGIILLVNINKYKKFKTHD